MHGKAGMLTWKYAFACLADPAGGSGLCPPAAAAAAGQLGAATTAAITVTATGGKSKLCSYRTISKPCACNSSHPHQLLGAALPAPCRTVLPCHRATFIATQPLLPLPLPAEAEAEHLASLHQQHTQWAAASAHSSSTSLSSPAPGQQERTAGSAAAGPQDAAAQQQAALLAELNARSAALNLFADEAWLPPLLEFCYQTDDLAQRVQFMKVMGELGCAWP